MSEGANVSQKVRAPGASDAPPSDGARVRRAPGASDAPPSDGARVRRAPAAGRLQGALGAAGVYLVVLLLMLLGTVLSKEFLTATNLLNTLRAVALLGIVASGVAFVTYSGHYADLSVPATMALSGIVAVATIDHGFAAGVAAALLAGCAVGLANGLVVGYLRGNPIIWTLAMGSVLDGFLRWRCSGTQIYPDAATAAGQAFLRLYGKDLAGGGPLIVLVLALLVAAGHLALHGTRYGAQLKLVGSAYPVARMTGVNVRRVVAVAFVLSAFTASLGGVLLASLNQVGAPYLGKDYDFMAVTAVVVGGVTLAGGRGSLFGVLGGVLVIGLMRNIMTLLTIGTFAQDIVQGIVFILVVGAHSYQLRKAGRDDA